MHPSRLQMRFCAKHILFYARDVDKESSHKFAKSYRKKDVDCHSDGIPCSVTIGIIMPYHMFGHNRQDCHSDGIPCSVTIGIIMPYHMFGHNRQDCHSDGMPCSVTIGIIMPYNICLATIEKDCQGTPSYGIPLLATRKTIVIFMLYSISSHNKHDP